MEQVTLTGNISSNSLTHTDVLSQRGYTILAMIMGVFSLTGIIFNILVIVVTVRHRKLRHPLNYALVNLAVCDLGCAVFGGLPTTFNSIMGRFSLGRLGCILGGFAVSFFGISGLCTVAVISVERYVVVCYPMGGVLFQTRHAVAGVVLSWVWSFVWNTPPLFGWGSYDLEGVQISCAPNWYSRDAADMSYIIIYFSLCFAVPFFTIIVSYSRLLWTLHQVTKLQTSESRRTDCTEKQVARMVVVMVLAFLVTWLPYAAMALAVIMDSSLYIDPVIATIPVYLAKSSTVYNPIIYIFMNRQFRGYIVPALLCGWSPQPSEAQISDATTTVASVNKNNKVVLEQSSKE
ncbi:PREDICTED: parapinopsin-like [Poecilia mexicana]|uniref:G-protein coupled receptors family 1 profile domain-containing protein n=1 Tax=Poecilia mexicana TaxID=48701 RepID=A0A3B3WPT5_9TELE|nr:PREDICTED: parapinopsin-like [Poecilia mexicana]